MTEREKELAAKAELRRARRMLSNRESARRSRKRKQEHLGELQGQIGNLTEEKEELADELESARAVIKRKDQEIQQLRAQNEQMRAQLGGSEAPAPAMMAKAPVKRENTASVRAASDSKPPLPGKAKVGKRKTADPDD
jgi:chromosome segregation ATPase